MTEALGKVARARRKPAFPQQIMCLALPGRLVQWIDRDPLFARATIEFDGVRRVCHMACVTDAEEGDYVIVHAGVAISKVNQAAALKTREELNAFGSSPELELNDLDSTTAGDG